MDRVEPLTRFPFRLPRPADGSARGLFRSAAAAAAERLLHLPRLQQVYQQVPPESSPAEFCERALELLDVSVEVRGEDLAHIPGAGPAVLCCNHPFGAIEGLILGALLPRIRPDVRILANHFLDRIPELHELMISVDPTAPGRRARPRAGAGDAAGAVDAGEASRNASRNFRPMREAIRWLRAGGLLVLFPSGAVSDVDFRSRRVLDPEWRAHLAVLFDRTDAAAVPVYFQGRNSAVFQAAGALHLHRSVRTAMLPRELLRRSGGEVGLRVGRPIASSRLRELGGRAERMEHLRLRTYLLGELDRGAPRQFPLVRIALPRRRTVHEPVALPEDPEELAREIAALPPERVRVKSGTSLVIEARAAEIPGCLREIGRLREQTFRAVGEGTGRARDLDRWDLFYRQLFLWSEEQRQIVGGYRLGPSEEILPERGLEGLYTQSLFRFDAELFERLGPCLELGRSFVREESQRSYGPLLLLWKGIGAFLVENLQYRYLFGPVSISHDYAPLSRRLMAEFLSQRAADGELQALIRPRHAFRASRLPGARGKRPATPSLGGLEDLAEAVLDVERERSGIPVLLRQYVKLGAQLLGLSVDPAFGHTLDALVLVDLMRTSQRTLERYLGREGTARLRAHHGGADADPGLVLAG